MQPTTPDIDQLDEGLGSQLSLAAIITLLGIGSFASPKSLSENLPKKEKITRTDVDTAVKKLDTTTKIGKYTKAQVANILARTIYSEARNQSHDGRLAIMSVIWNRAGGNSTNFVDVCFKKKQFSWWNSISPSTNANYTPEKYKITVPTTLVDNNKNIIKAEQKVWNDSVKIANDVLNTGKFKSNIGKNNMIINKDLDNSKALNSWGKNGTMTIGDHEFGYEKCWDGWNTKKVVKPNVHVVKKGEVLSKIAKAHKMTLKQLLAKNPQIKDVNKIAVGQKINI